MKKLILICLLYFSFTALVFAPEPYTPNFYFDRTRYTPQEIYNLILRGLDSWTTGQYAVRVVPPTYFTSVVGQPITISSTSWTVAFSSGVYDIDRLIINPSFVNDVIMSFDAGVSTGAVLFPRAAWSLQGDFRLEVKADAGVSPFVIYVNRFKR